MSGEQCYSENCHVFDCDNVVHAGDLGTTLTNFRPHGSLARALYLKQQQDEYLNQIDKTEVSVFMFRF